MRKCLLTVIISAMLIARQSYTEKIHHVAKKGSIEDIKKILTNHIQINQQDENGNTPLHIACCRTFNQKFFPYYAKEFKNKKNQFYQETFKIVKLLIKKGANINAKTKKGNTPLHEAVENIILVSKNLPDPIKKFPPHLQKHFKNQLEILVDKEPLIVEYLIENKVNVNAQNNQGNTPLHIACKRHLPENLKVVKRLIENGAEINAKNADGKTPLLMAGTLIGYPKIRFKIVKYLLENGADPNIKYKGKTVFALIDQSLASPAEHEIFKKLEKKIRR